MTQLRQLWSGLFICYIHSAFDYTTASDGQLSQLKHFSYYFPTKMHVVEHLVTNT